MKALAGALICLIALNNTDTSHCRLSLPQHATLPVIFSSIPPSLSLQSHLVSLLSFYLTFSNVLKAIFPCLASVIFYSPFPVTFFFLVTPSFLFYSLLGRHCCFFPVFILTFSPTFLFAFPSLCLFSLLSLCTIYHSLARSLLEVLAMLNA